MISLFSGFFVDLTKNGAPVEQFVVIANHFELFERDALKFEHNWSIDVGPNVAHGVEEYLGWFNRKLNQQLVELALIFLILEIRRSKYQC